MKRIGIVLAVELPQLLDKYSDIIFVEKHKNIEVYCIKKNGISYYIISTGAGEIFAAAAVQILYDLCDIDLLINAGIVGAISNGYDLFQTVVVERVVHYEMDVSATKKYKVGQYPHNEDIFLYTTDRWIKAVTECFEFVKAVTCASGNRLVLGKEAKQDLHNRFYSDICDMESAAIVSICNKLDIQHIIIKTISDTLDTDLDSFRENSVKASIENIKMLSKVIDSINL